MAASNGPAQGLHSSGSIAPLPIEISPLYSRETTAIPGEQHVYRFPNGYGASVIRNGMSYGGAEGFYEMAVLRFDGDGDDDWHLTYETAVTSDVIGWLEVAEVARVLLQIAMLKEPS